MTAEFVTCAEPLAQVTTRSHTLDPSVCLCVCVCVCVCITVCVCLCMRKKGTN